MFTERKNESADLSAVVGIEDTRLHAVVDDIKALTKSNIEHSEDGHTSCVNRKAIYDAVVAKLDAMPPREAFVYGNLIERVLERTGAIEGMKNKHGGFIDLLKSFLED